MKEIEALGIELLQQISVSNFSVVFKGRQSLLQRDVCVKVCVDGMQENSRERFLREAKVLTELKHPNIAGLLMYGLAEERPFMVLEWLDGTTLQERIKSGPLNPEEAISIFGQLTDALEYTHKLGIVHRDLKPANDWLILRRFPIDLHVCYSTHGFGVRMRVVESASKKNLGGCHIVS